MRATLSEFEGRLRSRRRGPRLSHRQSCGERAEVRTRTYGSDTVNMMWTAPAYITSVRPRERTVSRFSVAQRPVLVPPEAASTSKQRLLRDRVGQHHTPGRSHHAASMPAIACSGLACMRRRKRRVHKVRERWVGNFGWPLYSGIRSGRDSGPDARKVPLVSLWFAGKKTHLDRRAD